jgi:hypothetical protein
MSWPWPLPEKIPKKSLVEIVSMKFELNSNSTYFQRNRIYVLTSNGNDRFGLQSVSSLIDEDVSEVVLRQIRRSHPASSHKCNYKNPKSSNISRSLVKWACELTVDKKRTTKQNIISNITMKLI